MRVKVYKLEISIIDFDQIGEEEIRLVLENTRYPNHCITPKVRAIESREIEWSDDHPLNRRISSDQAFADLFAAEA